MTPVNYILVNEKKFSVDDIPVYGVAEHGLTFQSFKPRTMLPDLVVLHDTAGEGDGRSVFKTLSAKRLSVHFVIDRKGAIWQFLDPYTAVAAHAGKGNNSRSIGIETANAVFPPGVKPGLFVNLKQYAITAKEKLMGRPVVVDGYRGGKRRLLGHFQAQRDAAFMLVTAILDAFQTIPRRIPRLTETGKLHGYRVPDGWQGVCGHLHLTDAHVDPALDLMDGIERLLG